LGKKSKTTSKIKNTKKPGGHGEEDVTKICVKDTFDYCGNEEKVCLSELGWDAIVLPLIKQNSLSLEGKMAFCGKCGAQLHENATFCAACGTPTGVPAQTPAGTTPVITHPVGVRLEESKGFFGSLFDFSFTSFVTGKVIKVLYVLLMIVLVLALVVFVVLTQNQPYPAGIVALIAAPIIFFLYLILIRVYMEILIVIFRMSEHLAEIAQQGRR
jgi:hypothetical protein